MEQVVQSLFESSQGRISNCCLAAVRKGGPRVASVPGGVVHFLRERGTFLSAPVVPSMPRVLHSMRRRSARAIMLHFPNPMASLSLAISLVFRAKREKIAVWYHADVVLQEVWKRALYALFRPVDEYIFRRADAFIAATPNHVASSPVLARFADRVTTIPFALPDNWFDPAPGDEAAGAEIRKRLGGRYILFVGRLVPYKGLHTLVEAASGIDGRIALVGTGPLESGLRREIAARGVESKVSMVGRVEDLRPWYAGCEFLALPSNSALEAFGIVQIEAMGLGKPVVSSDLPTGVTWVNRDGETGLTFPVGDAPALARACNRLLSDDGYRRFLGGAARERARREFSYTALGERFYGFCRDHLSGSIKPRGVVA